MTNETWELGPFFCPRHFSFCRRILIFQKKHKITTMTASTPPYVPSTTYGSANPYHPKQPYWVDIYRWRPRKKLSRPSILSFRPWHILCPLVKRAISPFTRQHLHRLWAPLQCYKPIRRRCNNKMRVVGVIIGQGRPYDSSIITKTRRDILNRHNSRSAGRGE